MAAHSHTGWPCKICGYPNSNVEYINQKWKDDLDTWFDNTRISTRPNHKTMREGPELAPVLTFKDGGLGK